MNAKNHFSIVGNIGNVSELKETKTGTAYLNFSVAVNKRYKKDGETQTLTSWFNLTLWDKRASALSSILSKGMMVAVSGELLSKTQEIEGKKYSMVDMRVASLEILQSTKKGEDSISGDDFGPSDDMGDDLF